jgi:putative ABC transport system permease protein
MPIAAHLALPGVRAATPALRYESFGNVINMTDNGTNVNVLGVEPATAGTVMWYRSDFAGRGFDQLLHVISAPVPNAIVSDSFLSATGLHQGDTFGVTLTNGARVSLRAATVAQYFPSLDPNEFPFVVTNLTYLEHTSGSHGPNEVWLDTDQNQAAIDRVLLAAHQWPRQVLSYEGLPPDDATLGNPLSAGIYGVVSVGFLVAVVLVLLGFVAYTYLTLQQRIAEVAVLRALGLSPGQVRSLLLFEEVFLLGTAILGGIAAGVLTTRLFLPYLPIAANVVPPFVVVMPWLAVGEFVLSMLIVFVLVLSMHVSLLLRVQLGQVLRLGEA